MASSAPTSFEDEIYKLLMLMPMDHQTNSLTLDVDDFHPLSSQLADGVRPQYTGRQSTAYKPDGATSKTSQRRKLVQSLVV